MRKFGVYGFLFALMCTFALPQGYAEGVDKYGVPTIEREAAALERATSTLENGAEADEAVPAPTNVEVGGAEATRTVEERLADFDEVQVGKVQVIPYLLVKNFTPRFDFRIHATLNFEGTLNRRLDEQDSEKKEDSANSHGIVLRPDKDLIEAVRAALEWNLGSMGETQAVIVIEAGKGRIMVGDMPNANFFDYSALEVFNIDQTGFISVGVDAGQKAFLRFEIFNLDESEKGNFGKSFNLAGEWVFSADADGEPTLRAYVAGTHNEPDFDNKNAVVALSTDQNQYTVGGEVRNVPYLGNVNEQYVYRDNDNGAARDDQGFSVTLDRGLDELLVGMLGMLSYEYLDTRDSLLGKHQVRLGGRYYPQWLVPEPAEDADEEDLEPQRTWYLQGEWGHGSNGNSPIGSSRDRKSTRL